MFHFSFYLRIHILFVFLCSILHFCHDLVVFAAILEWFNSLNGWNFIFIFLPTDRPSFLSSLARKTTNQFGLALDKSPNRSHNITIGTTIGSIVFIIALIVGVYCQKRRLNRRRSRNSDQPTSLENSTPSTGAAQPLIVELPQIQYQQTFCNHSPPLMMSKKVPTIFPLSPSKLFRLLLFGDETLAYNTNHGIINFTVEFILETSRFSMVPCSDFVHS